MKKLNNAVRWLIAFTAMIVFTACWMQRADAQDQEGDQDDPPSRVARLAYLQGSVSFEPAGESDWVEAVSNRPMTTGDKIWADKDARAQLELGTAVVYLNSNTGVSLLNLDDRTAQLELSAGSIDVRVRQLDRDNVFEIDTPNQAFTVMQPGRYRVEASEDGSYTVVSIREGEGESTGNGQTYTVRAGQRATFEGTDTLNAQVEDLGNPDDFDNWSNSRDRRYDESRSAQYCSHDMVGYEDLDESGDWQANSSYGNVWYPHVAAGWAPYREGHWAWVDPWGWTWVDEEPWGYAPFHYGRWLSIEGRWGWIPGPREVAPVYAPALVVFVGGGGGFGENVGWFPLGPREVYVPSYGVSRGYFNRVNVSNTTVNTTTITNVYNTTIINKSTTITNVNYVNRGVRGAVTAVPQRAFASAQPVSRNAVAVNASELNSARMTPHPAVAPTSNSVLGAHANTANHVAAPPQSVARRQVIAKKAPPPPPVPFSARQQALAAHPGQPLARQELRRQAPANAAQAQPQVKVAPPGKPATPTVARGNRPANGPANQPANRPGTPPAANERPGARPENNPSAPNNRPEPSRAQPNTPQPNNRPAEPPARNDRPGSAQPNNRPEPNARPEPNRPETNRPEPNRAEPNNRPAQPPARNDRPPSAQPNSRPEPNRAEPNRPEPNARPEPNRPEPNRPEPNRAEPNNRPAEPPARNDRPATAQPNNRPEPNRPEPNARPEPNRPEPNRSEPNRPQANNRSAEPPARSERAPAPPAERRQEANPPREAARPNEAKPTSPSQHSAPPAESRPANKPQQHSQPEPRKEEPKGNDHKPPGLA